jgi:hypothetical protein
MMLVDSIPISVSFGPVSSSFKKVKLSAAIDDKSRDVLLEVKRGLNFAKSSKEVTPSTFSLNPLKLIHSGKMSNYAKVLSTSVVVMNIEE